MSLQKSENLKTPTKTILKKSKRSFAEQFVGLLIFIGLTFSAWMFVNAATTLNRTFGDVFLKYFWLIPSLIFGKITFLIYLGMALSFWLLWRTNSFLKLKLETFLFFLQPLFLILWYILFFTLQESLLALFLLLTLMSISVICGYVFWKKDRWAGYALLPLLLWNMYAIFLNMLITISYP